ncbi:MAG TPA: AAA family ATPase [Actinomycetes bacterium]|nr:AAA family ATPase [Actinomycetes bacterium]
MVTCASCGAQNPAGKRFCGDCGVPLSLVCPGCGSENPPGKKFCGDCGLGLLDPAAAPLGSGPRPLAALSERRLVSVVFVDLVGFTSLSESRDPEEVREILTRYYDNCRRLVALYGGIVEKFIGDAVMAVWGTPIAQEDDAERAVRAGLDLVGAVAALGEELGVPSLQARAGVLTGEAAVNLAAEGEGMVAGDLVNTAARIQAVAEPGTVLVGDSTRRASDLAIAYSSFGEHLLKGKTEPVLLWRAVRVTAAVGGAQRSEALEAPFVGREREMRLVKELFHASADESCAHLVHITGIAGIGKSRLVWEFFKYLDGLAESVWWHRGRCLSYGEGVAYWALAEMVRVRARILEGENPEEAREKLAACLEEYLPDPDERAWVGPRVANLLGLQERVDSDRPDLFAAWRMFFERLADVQPVVLVFEDLQWADQGLLAFIEFLLEWSASQRLYVIACSRPELADSHPNFGRGVRNAAVIGLEPLTDSDMSRLLEGYVPGLPQELKARVLERAEGVPLYAVETVRMLLDRGLLVQTGAVYQPTGAIETLEVPETLHALVAARLDGLPAPERRLVQDACVLGKTFTKQALAALTGVAEAELDPLLSSLVRKEVLSLQLDPRSAERGQYGFLQDLLRQLAYETLSRHDRRARHLAAVTALEATLQGLEEDAPEVIAAHLVAAVAAVPDAPDVVETRARAVAALVQAGERAASLAAPEDALRQFDQAAEFAADDVHLRSELLQRAGVLALQSGDSVAARSRLELAVQLAAPDDPAASARASVALADVDVAELRLDTASNRLRAAVPTLERDGPSRELAATLASLGRMQMLRGELDEASETLERALGLAEVLGLGDVLAGALTSKGNVLVSRSRLVEARVLLQAAVDLSRAVDSPEEWLRSANNLANALEGCESYSESIAVCRELEQRARQRGDTERLVTALLGMVPSLVELGMWAEALQRIDEASSLQASRFAGGEAVSTVPLLCERGESVRAAHILEAQDWQQDTDDPELVAAHAYSSARLLRHQGRHEQARIAAERGFSLQSQVGIDRRIKGCFVEALEASLSLGELAKAGELLSWAAKLHPGQLTPTLRGESARFHARVEAMTGASGTVEANFRAAESEFADHDLAFRTAVVRLELAEWLLGQARPDDADKAITSARETFERLGAAPWLTRAVEAQSQVEVALTGRS